MRDLFRGYYRPTKEEFDSLWDNCIFSFDTNILLNIYRYTPKTRERFFDILDKLQERIWLPYQAAYEYQEERLNVISQQLKPYSELQKSLNDHLEKFQEILEKYSKRHSFSDFVDARQIVGTIERAYKRVNKVLTDSNSNYPNLLDQDDFRENLTDLFDDRVGQPYSEEDLAKIYKDAEKRFKDSSPPGYMDSRGSNKKEPPECYGDVIIWFQLIDYARDQKKPLIFVTDDQKEDWWLERRGKVLGPRPELIQEMFAKANVAFYLYTGERFLDQARNFLSLSNEPEVIEEAREVGLEYEVFQKSTRLANINTDTFQAIARAMDTGSFDRLANINTDAFQAITRAMDTGRFDRLANINTDAFQAITRAVGMASFARLVNINTDNFLNKISSIARLQSTSVTNEVDQSLVETSEFFQASQEARLNNEDTDSEND